ncbi:bacteriophage protein [Burkholderia multivorans ATCC 17616]|uniref:Bacteriophage protein n=1 Tax=Burkholderia multivorans (strain ATCC 17616 / 249) TaxID=395019 RepID=A0A0H3KSE1_BURM1|nr:gp29 [Burkholderia phage Bcep176]ABA60030.1 gp29 [Burkholderia phage Bcep176]BAG46517.1 bacteriophage protein [Burkholderia multivorans ATCC 17616]
MSCYRIAAPSDEWRGNSSQPRAARNRHGRE